MEELDNDANNWNIEDPDQDAPEPKRKRKPSPKGAEMSTYNPNYVDPEGLRISNSSYGFPNDLASDTDLIFMESDMQGTVQGRHVKNRFERVFPNPDILWFSVLRYFEWVDAHPFQQAEMIKSGPNAGRIMTVPKKRPYTVKGLRIFLGMSPAQYTKYREGEDYEPFHVVIGQAEEVIYNDQFEGAASGFYNPNVVSKNLGLTEKTETKMQIDGEYTIIGMNIL